MTTDEKLDQLLQKVTRLEQGVTRLEERQTNFETRLAALAWVPPHGIPQGQRWPLVQNEHRLVGHDRRSLVDAPRYFD